MSPASAAVNVGPKAVGEIENNWDRFAREGRSLFVMGRDFKHSVLNFTPRDIEYAAQREFTRDTILAVFEVPPARAGLATANYGTQKQQMRTYWESLLKGQGALFEDEWSTLSPDGARIEHDTSNIEALQLNRTERQLRSERWMNSFGMSPADAAEAEGFKALPEGSLPAVAPGNQSRPPAREPEEPQRASGLAEGLARYLQGAAVRYQDRVLQADGDPSCLEMRGSESLRVLGALEAAGVEAGTALMWADEVASVSDEAVRMTATEAWDRGVTRIGLECLSVFGADRAAEVAARISADVRSAA